MAFYKQQSFIMIVVMAALGAGLLIANVNYKEQLQVESQTQSKVPSMRGQHRPDFTLTNLKGVSRTVGDWDGQVMVVNFWASWCKPCLREIPAFIELQQRYGDQGVQFVGITLEDARAVKVFSAQLDQPINYPILVGEDDAIEIAKAYGNEYGILPYTVFIGRDGVIDHSQYGEVDGESVEQIIQGLI